jgi:predicted dienelactone hydrolase
MVAYYPAVTGTGHGLRSYASPALLGVYGATMDDFASIAPSAQILAEPLRDSGARPVVILAPGGGSFIELSTSLAEELASHGYVVIAVQPDVTADGILNPGDGDYSESEVNLLATSTDQMRLTQISDAIELLSDPLTTDLVGPVDPARVAVGGHSYAGSIAFNASLTDPRIASVFDLDGTLFGDASATAVSVPSLVVMTDLGAEIPPELVGEPGVAESLEAAALSNALLRIAPNTVSVGLLDADHFAVTDLPAILGSLPEPLRTVAAEGAGGIGRDGTTSTNAIVLRFLDASLATEPRLPSPGELVDGLPGTTANPPALAA